MMKFTHKQMWVICQSVAWELDDVTYTSALQTYEGYLGESDEAEKKDLVSPKQYEWLLKHEPEFKIVCCSWAMSENHPGGEEITGYVDSAVEAERAGFRVQTWYGDDSEVLIVGIREGSEIEIGED